MISRSEQLVTEESEVKHLPILSRYCQLPSLLEDNGRWLRDRKGGKLGEKKD